MRTLTKEEVLHVPGGEPGVHDNYSYTGIYVDPVSASNACNALGALAGVATGTIAGGACTFFTGGVGALACGLGDVPQSAEHVS